MDSHGYPWIVHVYPWIIHGYPQVIHGYPWTINAYPWIINWYPWISIYIHGYPWISMDIPGYPLTSMDILGYPWISMDIHGGTCLRPVQSYMTGGAFLLSPLFLLSRTLEFSFVPRSLFLQMTWSTFLVQIHKSKPNLRCNCRTIVESASCNICINPAHGRCGEARLDARPRLLLVNLGFWIFRFPDFRLSSFFFLQHVCELYRGEISRNK